MTKKGRFSYATSPVPVGKQAEQPAKPEKLAKSTKPAMPSKQAQLTQAEQLEKLEVLAELVKPSDALVNPAAYIRPAMKRGRRAAGEETGVKRTDVPSEQLNVRVRPELKRAAAGYAGLNGMTLGDVVEAALVAFLKARR